jgi:hypothetical protein
MKKIALLAGIDIEEQKFWQPVPCPEDILHEIKQVQGIVLLVEVTDETGCTTNYVPSKRIAKVLERACATASSVRMHVQGPNLLKIVSDTPLPVPQKPARVPPFPQQRQSSGRKGQYGDMSAVFARQQGLRVLPLVTDLEVDTDGAVITKTGEVVAEAPGLQKVIALAKRNYVAD